MHIPVISSGNCITRGLHSPSSHTVLQYLDTHNEWILLSDKWIFTTLARMYKLEFKKILHLQVYFLSDTLNLWFDLSGLVLILVYRTSSFIASGIVVENKGRWQRNHVLSSVWW